uniref:RNase H type-1 domain-containing protein n=1 Tax=Fagus sylvatica TaxID=28930 RepID=A0A2N9E606_FAGSY
MEKANRDQPSHSNLEIESNLWKNIWSLKVIPRVKSFLWRACLEALPTKANLFNRHLATSPLFDECHQEPEDIMHVIWYCKITNEVWRDYKFLAGIYKISPPMSLAGLLSVVMNCKNEVEIQSFAAIAWLLWNRRNKRRFEHVWDSTQSIKQHSLSLIEEYATTCEVQGPSCPTSTNIQWSPLRGNHRKINFDGALFAESNSAGIGVIVRDSSGNPEATLSKRIVSPSSPATIEALAALEAVKLAKNLGLTEVEFEEDASEIISALEDPSANLSMYGNIISDTQLEAGSLQWFCFSHVKRKANEVAHVLARKAKDIVDSFLWTQLMPPDVIHN